MGAGEAGAAGRRQERTALLSGRLGIGVGIAVSIIAYAICYRWISNVRPDFTVSKARTNLAQLVAMLPSVPIAIGSILLVQRLSARRRHQEQLDATNTHPR